MRAPRSSDDAAALDGEVRVLSRPSHHEAQPDPTAPKVVVDPRADTPGQPSAATTEHDDEPTARRKPSRALLAKTSYPARVNATATQHLDPDKRAELLRQSKERT